MSKTPGISPKVAFKYRFRRGDFSLPSFKFYISIGNQIMAPHRLDYL